MDTIEQQTDPFNAHVARACNCLLYGQSETEVAQELVGDGVAEEDVYFIVQAAKTYNRLENPWTAEDEQRYEAAGGFDPNED